MLGRLDIEYQVLVREACMRSTTDQRRLEIRKQLTSIRRLKKQFIRGAMLK